MVDIIRISGIQKQLGMSIDILFILNKVGVM